MSKHQDALLRQWSMLRRVPRYPAKVTVQALRRKLADDGFEITQRSLQRDLNELSSTFAIACDDREKPYGWSWQKDAPSFDLPGLTPAQALTLAMAEQHLQNLLPSPMLDQLRPYFLAARQRLDAEPAPRRSRRWLDKVRSVPATQALMAPSIDAGVQDAVTEALLHERQLDIRYRRRGERTDAQARVHPLALVQRGPVLYLSCRFYDYEDARMLPLHRISSAQVREEAARYPKDFSLDKQIEGGEWAFGSGKKIKLEAVFEAAHGGHLYETPLSKDQKIDVLPDDRLHVTATVADTPQLVWWLLGFGSGVEVMSPTRLRGKVQAEALSMRRTYLRSH
ncbi:helix-turn-helix transcriptional regulator [Rudaea sp.]|uniref:helix-turn-helix transcriptional regulator n=1 Tax=Rudaea sp. TaxID=2136325 RepID=UPI003783BAC8